ncbi:MAG: glycosyltransferase family 39 protein [Patescibacteria group bacterium]|jgi:4-amino-4-deoxy-L-arabinose transferase-like glycosyltransferase
MPKTKLLLVLILLLAATLRVFGLNQHPIELFGDELDVGYHAFSLWKSGQDYMGQKFPLYIHSLNEWRAPLLMYITAPFVGILGLNEWGVRLPPAVFGIVSVFLIYLLVMTLSKNSRLSLIAAFVCSITPWHIHYSRAAFESTLLLTLVLLGVVAILKNKWFLAGASFALSFYTYNTANAFVPLLLFGIVLLCRERIKLLTKKSFSGAALMVLLTLPLLFIIVFGQGATRFKSLSIFNDPKSIDQIVFKRTTGNFGVERLFHNKLTFWADSFLGNYLTSFSPQFLFTSGDPNPRHNVPLTGQFPFWTLPFLLAGIFGLLKSKEGSFKRLTFLWLLLAPIPSALTTDGGNHATRLFLMIPALVILIAWGIDWLLSVLAAWKLRLVAVFLLMIAFVSLGFWFHEYTVHYQKEQSHYWDAGYKEPLSWLKANQLSYSRIILNNNHDPILLRYLFWTAKDPSWLKSHYQGDFAQKDILPGFDGFVIDGVFFGKITAEDKENWLRENLDEKTVYLAFQKDEIPGNWDWQKSPPEGVKVLSISRNVFSGEPHIYLLTKDTLDEKR